MSQTIEYLGAAVDPGILLRGLTQEGFLPDYLENPDALAKISAQLRWFMLKDENGPFAILAQAIGPQPQTANVWLFLERKGSVKELKPEFREFGQILWNLWFKELGLERVQSFVPLSKLKHLKLLTSWRFQEETRMGGCRKGIKIAGKWQDLAVLGLVQTDLPSWWHKAQEESKEVSNVRVG
jgi:hypothetical protein